jgi:glycosyltransferase involved in cell wall biosynthesis
VRPIPAISVILPVHNGAAYLQEALDSIFRQTFRDFEVIVIDDCSTDASPSIAESFGDSRLILIRSSERLRISKALNLGIEHARGKFIARMDADDICHPLRLERQFTFLMRYPQIGFCGTWVRRFGEGQNPQTYHRPVGSTRVRAFSIFDNPIVHSSAMIRRDILARLEICYRNEFVDAEDYDLWTRLLEFTQGDNIPEILLDYRVHEQSVTLQKSESMDRMACRILKRELAQFGMEVTDKEVLQHRRWSTGRLDSESEPRSLELAGKWLQSLQEANRTSRACDSNALLWAAREIWFALCYRALRAGKPVLKQFLLSPISRTDFKNGMILLGAMVKRGL